MRAILNLGEGAHTISVDELTGIAALETATPDLMPTREHGVIKRDYEHMRFGQPGAYCGEGHWNRRGGEPWRATRTRLKLFIEFLKLLDARYT